MDRLDATAIAVPGLEARVVDRCDSTNARLLAGTGMDTGAHTAAGPVLLAAETQTAGRGRRGRKWRSARGAGTTFSIRRRMRCAPAALAGLSLAVGVAAARALRGLGAVQVSLKWPNDLVVGSAKLGGILVETRQSGGEAVAVVGIGINHRADPGLQVGRPVVALEQLMAALPARNEVITAVAREVLAMLEEFERRGLAPFTAPWAELHAHEGARLRVRLADGRTLSGLARGVAANGALRLATARGLREVVTGRIVQHRSAR